MFNRDTLRLIKRTYKRFLSLFLIVTIGVAFMVGLMSTSPIMRRSVDVYDDSDNLQDLQIYSSYGFCDEDIKALADTRGVSDVFASRFVDVYGRGEDNEDYVVRVQEMTSDVNKIELKEGRLPQNGNEAVVLRPGSMGGYFEIGEKISLHLEEENALREALKYQNYTIVGYVDTPQYMALTNETSTLDNLELDTVIFVMNDNFKSEYYTSVYLTLEEAEDYDAFSDEYKDYVERSTMSVERTKANQGNYLKDKIIKDYEEEIDEGEKTLNEEKAKAEKELEDAQKALDDAYVQILVGEAQIEANRVQVETAEKTIAANEELLDSNAATINEAIKQIEESSGMSYTEAYEQIAATYNIYIFLEQQKTDAPASIETLRQQISENEETIAQNEETIASLEEELLSVEDEAYRQELETKISELQDENVALKEANQIMEDTIAELESDSIQDALDEMDAAAGGSVKETYANLSKLVDGKEQLDAGYAELQAGKAELEAGKTQLEEAEKSLASGRYEYNNGVKELADARYEFEKEIEKAENDLALARQELSELPDAEWTILNRDQHYSSYMYANTVDQMHSIGVIFPLLFFLVAALVCMTTMTRLIDEERSQLGIFAALGFSKGKIISKYLLYALLASLSGSLIGMGIGIFIFPTVIYEAWHLMYNLPAMQLYLPLDIAVLGALAFTFLMLLVTYLVARSSLKEMPAQLMRPKAPKNAKKVFLEKIPILWRSLSFTSKITARNLIRYKSRFFMTVIGVAGCTGLLVAGFGIKDSISGIIETQFSDIFDYNNTINLSDDQHLSELLEALNADANNEQSVPFLNYSTKVYLADEEEKTITVQVYDDRQIDRVMNLRTSDDKTALDIHGDGVIISEKFAKVNDLDVGDEMVIESENGIKGTVVVDGICELYFQHYLFISDALYEDTFNETVHPNAVAVKAQDNEIMMADIEGIEGVESVVDFTPMIANFQNMLDALDFIILVIILSSGSLALVVLMNLTEVNISERIREIATIKVLGFNNHEVNSYIFKEIILLTIIGALVGLPLGKVEHNLIMTVIDMEMVMFGMNINFLSYLYAFLITMSFTLIVLLLMSRNLRKIKMVESLKSVE